MKRILFITVIFSLLFQFNTIAYTPYESRMVTLPTFSVTVNEQEYNYNEYETYPVFVKDGITYFPLTYNNAIILNLIPTWNEETCSHEYVRGNSNLPKQFFKREITNKVETEIGENTVRIDSVTYQVHHPKENRNQSSFMYHYQEKEDACKTLIDGKNIVVLWPTPDKEILS